MKTIKEIAADLRNHANLLKWEGDYLLEDVMAKDTLHVLLTTAKDLVTLAEELEKK